MTSNSTPLTLLLQGKLAEAESAAIDGIVAAVEQQAWEAAARLFSVRASVALTRGDFDQVERYALGATEMSERAAAPWAARDALQARLGAMALQGRWQAAHSTLQQLHNPAMGQVVSGAVPVYRLLLRAYQSQSLIDPLRPLATTLLRARTSDPEWLGPLCALVELGEASLLSDLTHAPAKWLAQALARGLVLSPGWVLLVPRHLGIAATLRGDWVQADAYFQRATDLATAAQATPELGRTYLAYARLLRVQPNTRHEPRIPALLDHAYGLFESLGMTPFAAAAVSLKRTL